jgi:uncharacterized membrane protein YhiD involved in acid resistance
MRKNDLFFTFILLFVVKLILLPASFADAAVLLVLLAYRPVSQLLKLQEKQKISDANKLKFETVSEEIAEVKKTLDSIKIQENMKQSFGIKK